MSGQGGLRRLAPIALVAPLAVLAAAVLCWWPLLGLELYGWDTYPMIAAGRFGSLAEFFGNLGEELMEGNFPGGRYWRPLVHLSFGLDHALWGLDPRGYRITDLAVLALGALAVHSLMRRLIASEVGALVAGLVYATHPLHWELLPLPARRADALCALFTVLALRAMTAEAPRGTPKTEQLRLPVGPWCAPRAALWCGLAMASKETGILSVPLCFALGWMARDLHSSSRRLFAAGVVLVAYAALRTWILGEVGGGPRSSLAGACTNAPEFAGRYGILLAYPVPFLGAVEPLHVTVALLALVVAALGFLLAGERGVEPPLGAGRVLALAALWLALVLLMTSASGVKRSWYSIAFLPPWTLVLGTFAALAWRRVERAGDAHRFSWPVTLTVALAFGLGGHLALDIAAEKRASAEAANDLTRRFERAVESAAGGATLEVDARPPEDAAVRHGESTQRPMTLPPYGLEAYARLRWPTRRVRCEVLGAVDIQPPAEDEVLVLLRSR